LAKRHIDTTTPLKFITPYLNIIGWQNNLEVNKAKEYNKIVAILEKSINLN
jgi:hypothetical protein